MSNDETYNGWKNRETWAFNLHWANDRGLYEETLEQAKQWLAGTDDPDNDYALGEMVISYWRDFLDSYAEDFGQPLTDDLLMFDREVGSWWRVDEAETGAAVRESLS